MTTTNPEANPEPEVVHEAREVRARGRPVPPHPRYDEGMAEYNWACDVIEAYNAGRQSAQDESSSREPSHAASAGLEQWQPITTAPLDGTHVLLAFGQDGVAEGWWEDADPGAYPWKFVDRGCPGSKFSNGELLNGAREVRGGPSHWMPLPLGPRVPNEGSRADPSPPQSAPEAGLREDYERAPCGLCDSGGRCTFACETAENIPAPTLRQTLELCKRVLDDLAQPSPQLRKLIQMHDACARLSAEIDQALTAHPTPTGEE